MPQYLHLIEEQLGPGQDWASADASWRILSVSAGKAYWLSREANRFLEEGELVIVRPANEARIRASQLGDVVFHRFEFELDSVLGFFTLDERHFLETRLADAGGDARFIPPTHPEAGKFNNLIRARPQAPPLQNRVELFGVLLNLLQEILNYRARSYPRGNTAFDRFKNLITRMSDIELLGHSHRELAQLCRCGDRHFDRLFRRHFGATAREVQLKWSALKAVQEARELRASTRLSEAPPGPAFHRSMPGE